LSRTERPDKDSAGIRIDAPPEANPGGPSCRGGQLNADAP